MNVIIFHSCFLLTNSMKTLMSIGTEETFQDAFLEVTILDQVTKKLSAWKIPLGDNLLI